MDATTQQQKRIVEAGIRFMNSVVSHPNNTQLAIVRDNFLGDGMDGSFLEWLRDQSRALSASCLPVVEIEGGIAGESHLWRINGTLWAMPRRSWHFWTFFMVMRDGWSHASFLYPGAHRTNAFVNSRNRVVSWLERIGHSELANEVRRCRISGDMITYDAGRPEVQLVFR